MYSNKSVVRSPRQLLRMISNTVTNEIFSMEFLRTLLAGSAVTSILSVGEVKQPNCPKLADIGRRHVVPVLYARGSHYDVGYDVGRTFGALIKAFLACYERLREFERQYQTPLGRKAYQSTLENMEKRYPQYVKEIRGVADGAQVTFEQLFLLHLDDIIETINGDNNDHDVGGCSSIGLHRSGINVLGHTEDAFSETLNHFYILSAHITPTAEEKQRGVREERFASLCYAGCLPGYTMGFTSSGLVFSINTLSPLKLLPGRTPRTFLTRALLSTKNFVEAHKVLKDEGMGAANGFSVNMLWRGPNDIENADLYNVEVAPDPSNQCSQINVRQYEPNGEPLIHCNRYERLYVKEVIGPIIDSSEARLAVLRSKTTPKTRADVAAMLSDTSGVDYRVFQDLPKTVIKTIAAGIFDLNENTWNLYIDKPNNSKPVAVLPMTFYDTQ